MRKVWLCIFYALCIFTIVFSLFWMALPSLPFPAGRRRRDAAPSRVWRAGSAGQSGTDFYLCDEGGRVVVYTCSDNGLPDKRLLRTGIYVNLLPEADASGSSRASTSPAKRPSGRCWKTWANKQKQCRRSPGRSALFLSFIRIRLRAAPAGRGSPCGTARS